MRKSHLPEKIIRALLQLSLTEKEITAYICLLENGALSVQEISRITGINRVTIYSSIDELKQKGLVSESRRGKRRLFVAEEPEKLMGILERKNEHLKRERHSLENIILPALRAVDINQEDCPVFKFFEGEDGINRVYEEYILKKKEVINSGSYETAVKAVSFEGEVGYFKEIKKRNIFYRVILEDTPLNRKFAAAGKGIVHTKFLPEGERVTADIAVAGNITALISYDHLTATIIENESIAKSIKFHLDFMWDKLGN